MNGPSFFTFNPAMSQLGQRQFQNAPQTFYGQSMQQEQLRVRRDIDEAIRYNRPLSDQLWQYGQDVGAISRPFIATGGGKSGSYGGFGRGREEQPVPTPNLSAPLAGGPRAQAQPPSFAGPTQSQREPSTQSTPQPERAPRQTGYLQSQYGTGFSRTPMGFAGEPASFTSGGQYFGMTPKPTATSTPTPFPELNTRNYFSSTMGGIKFPFSGY